MHLKSRDISRKFHFGTETPVKERFLPPELQSLIGFPWMMTSPDHCSCTWCLWMTRAGKRRRSLSSRSPGGFPRRGEVVEPPDWRGLGFLEKTEDADKYIVWLSFNMSSGHIGHPYFCMCLFVSWPPGKEMLFCDLPNFDLCIIQK